VADDEVPRGLELFGPLRDRVLVRSERGLGFVDGEYAGRTKGYRNLRAQQILDRSDRLAAEPRELGRQWLDVGGRVRARLLGGRRGRARRRRGGGGSRYTGEQ